MAVAELAFAFLLGIDRRLPDNVAALRAHKWNKKEFSKADGVFGKTLGVVGIGQIGREVIKRARRSGLHVIAWSRSFNLQKAKELGVEYCPDLDTIFHPGRHYYPTLPSNPTLKKLVNADRIAMMKPKSHPHQYCTPARHRRYARQGCRN